MRAVVAVVPAVVSVEVASTTSKTKTNTKTMSPENRAKTAAPRLSSIKQRRIGFLLEEDISKLMDVLKELKDLDRQKLLQVVINKYDAGKYHHDPKTVATTPQSDVKNKRLFIQGKATAIRISDQLSEEMELINPSSQFASSVTGTNSTDLGKIMATEISTAAALCSS